MKAAPLLAAALLFCQLARAQEMPTPPEQTHPWTAPPTSLPAVVVSAAAALFDLGLADPRGCEYREVEIDLDHPLKTHAWVLPAGAGEARYAVGWNGLVYPVKSIRAPANLAQDVATPPRGGFGATGEAVGESHALSAESTLRIKVALLLRLGEARLAETFWQGGGGEDAEESRADPYADLAAVWLGSWYNRAVRAYLQDDQSAALAICRRLSPVLEKVRETARARGIPDPWPEHFDGLPFWQMPALMAEAQRRLDEPPPVPVLDSNQPPAGPERVAALIRDLALVRVHQAMMPGQTDVLDDGIVQALVQAGDAAVPALLRCLVDDPRLTSSRFTGGGCTWESGPIIPVYEAAYTALFRRLNVTFPRFARDGTDGRREREPRDLSPDERRALAAKLEACWRQHRGEDPLERAYTTLRDDGATAKASLQAVDDLVQPNDGTSTGYRLEFPAVGGYGYTTVEPPVPPRGEALRGRTDPSITELIIRRAGQLIADDANAGDCKPATLGKLLLSLAAWDGSGHLDDLRRLQGELQARICRLAATRAKPRINLYGAAEALDQVFEKRVAQGDASALQEDAAYLQASTPQSLSNARIGPADGFRLLWRHPDDPFMTRAAEKMFAEGSPWVPFVKSASADLSGLIRTPLLAVPAFQRELDRGLGDPSAAGEVKLGEDGHADDGTSRLYPLDPLAPPRGSKVAYRLCDRYAYELSRQNGFPRCELYWPLAARDLAVAASRVFLRRYADRFRYDDEADRNRDGDFNGMFTSFIHFPVLDHPATAEDVSAGRAIFSLPAPARVCRLPGLPQWVERPGRPEDPYGSLTDAASGGSHLYTTGGRVWQAEETLVDGRWERYYGFVGRYQLEKVPAAEIEFPSGRLGTNVTPEISGGIEIPRRLVGERFSAGSYSSGFVVAGVPVSVQVKVGNHSALDQTMPGVVVLPPGADRALPPGVHLSLAYSPKVPVRRRDYSDPPFDYGSWQDVPLRAEGRVTAGAASGPVLFPGQELTVLDLDLRDYFDVSRPGSYRLRGAFQVPGQPESQASESTFSVAP